MEKYLLKFGHGWTFDQDVRMQQPAKRTRQPVAMNGVDTPTLFATIDAVRGQPELARFTFRATNRWQQGTHSRSRIESFHGAGGEHQHAHEHVYDADHPAVLVGRDQGPTPVNQQVFMQPTSCGVALTSDGQTMVVVNYANDSVTIFTGGYGSWTRRVEQDLRPGKVDPANLSAAGVAGGEYPFWVVVKDAVPAAGATPAKGAKAYVSSLRDREVVVLDLESVIAATPTIKTTIKTIRNRTRLRGLPAFMASLLGSPASTVRL